MSENVTSARQEYDRLAAQYDKRWRPYINATLNAVLDLVEFKGREHVLDAPCGTGELVRRLLGRYPDLRVTGVDLSFEMLRQADRKGVVRNKLSWIQADVARLPFQDRVFDAVVCANSFHYFRKPEASLGQFRRVLKTGGSLFLVDWCDDYFMCKLCSQWLKWTDPAFHRMYSIRGCHKLLNKAGFKVRSAEKFRINWLWGLMRLRCV